MLNNIAILVVVMETKISVETSISKIKKYMDVEKNVSLIC